MGDGKFFKSLYIVGRGLLTPLFYKDPLSWLSPTFSNFVQPPSPFPQFPVSPIPTRTVLSVVLFLLLNGWSGHTWCAISLNDNMDLHISSLGTLVPEGPWGVFYATRCQVYWDLKNNVVFTGTLIRYHTHKNTQTHTTRSEASRLTHPWKYTFTPPVMCSQQLPLLH